MTMKQNVLQTLDDIRICYQSEAIEFTKFVSAYSDVIAFVNDSEDSRKFALHPGTELVSIIGVSILTLFNLFEASEIPCNMAKWLRVVIKCENCKARATMWGAFDKDAFEKLGSAYKCTGRHPWKNHSVDCSCYPRAMQRGVSSVYFPKVVSSLVTPPYSEKLNKDIETSVEFAKCLTKLEDDSEAERVERITRQIDTWATAIAVEISADTTAAKNILLRKWLNQGDIKYSTDSVSFRFEEYQALTGQIPKRSLAKDDFIIEEMLPADYSIKGIKKITLVHKVREVRALTGFIRINPPGLSELGEDTPGFVSIKEEKTNWYPAYEVRGEGIFLEFDKNLLSNWVTQYPEVVGRAETILANYRKSYYGGIVNRSITPQFILLHTLAHLLIRELSFESGYAAASLSERIYCCLEKETPMAGILIYTAGGDSEGTLGGLVHQGYSDCLPRIFEKATKSAKICSNDPMCVSSSGQGRDSLNLGACHSCTLLSETSCEEYNVFLDRGIVVGTLVNESIGYWGM